MSFEDRLKYFGAVDCAQIFHSNTLESLIDTLELCAYRHMIGTKEVPQFVESGGFHIELFGGNE